MFQKTLNWMQNDIKIPLKGKVLDIGAWYEEKSPKFLFKNYTGIDIRPGVGVDFVMSAYDISKKFKKNSFDIVLCLNVLEHVPDMGRILKQVSYVLKKGGYLLVTMPEFCYPTHNFPKDYWRCSEESMREFIMKGYKIINLQHARSWGKSKAKFINCVGKKL